MNVRTLSFYFAASLAVTACGSSTSPADTGVDTGTTTDVAADIVLTPDIVGDTPQGADTSTVDATDVVAANDVSDVSDATTASDVAEGGTADAGPDVNILPPVDAGNPFVDAGTLGPPPWVSLDVRTSTTCPALTPCGGNVVGTWDVAGGCFELPLGTALAACPGAMVTRTIGQARGRVTFDGTTANRLAQSQVEVDISVPAFCATAAGGCPAIQNLVQSMVPDSLCVTGAAGECNCAARQITMISDGDAYTIANNEIIGTTSHKHWAYCIAGTTMHYQDTSPTGTREPGIIQLTER